jgi:hypothetical protein
MLRDSPATTSIVHCAQQLVLARRSFQLHIHIVFSRVSHRHDFVSSHPLLSPPCSLISVLATLDHCRCITAYPTTITQVSNQVHNISYREVGPEQGSFIHLLIYTHIHCQTSRRHYTTLLYSTLLHAVHYQKISL